MSPVQALLLFPAVMEHPGERETSSAALRGTQHQESLSCPPNSQLEELQVHIKQTPLSTLLQPMRARVSSELQAQAPAQ